MDETGSTKPTRSWPEHATLVQDGYEIHLLRQNDLISKVAHKAIDKVTDDFVLRRAWPKSNDPDGYNLTVLKDACSQLVHQYPLVGDILQRVNDDKKFAKALAKIVR